MTGRPRRHELDLRGQARELAADTAPARPFDSAPDPTVVPFAALAKLFSLATDRQPRCRCRPSGRTRRGWDRPGSRGARRRRRRFRPGERRSSAPSSSPGWYERSLPSCRPGSRTRPLRAQRHGPPCSDRRRLAPPPRPWSPHRPARRRRRTAAAACARRVLGPLGSRHIVRNICQVVHDGPYCQNRPPGERGNARLAARLVEADRAVDHRVCDRIQCAARRGRFVPHEGHRVLDAAPGLDGDHPLSLAHAGAERTRPVRLHQAAMRA